jgi:hypothetical protein
MPKGFQARKWARGGAGTPFTIRAANRAASAQTVAGAEPRGPEARAKPADAAWEPFDINPKGWGGSHRDAASGSLTLGPTKAFVAFLASLGWRPSAAPTHDSDRLLT